MSDTVYVVRFPGIHRDEDFDRLVEVLAPAVGYEVRKDGE